MCYIRMRSSSRFHRDPRMQATELLLQERVPREAIVSEPRPARRRAGEDRRPSDQRAAVSNATYR